MSALYVCKYEGLPGSVGGAVLYVGNGTIMGADVGDGRYHGAYVEEGGRLKGRISLTAPPGTPLVTGQAATGPIQLDLDWPANFAGQVQTVSVQGHPVRVHMEKLGEVPQ